MEEPEINGNYPRALVAPYSVVLFAYIARSGGRATPPRSALTLCAHNLYGAWEVWLLLLLCAVTNSFAIEVVVE